MGMTTLENALVRVQISDKGAELCSLYDKRLGAELLWQADAAYWNRHAPVLFPFVGKVYGGSYRTGGEAYPMGQHGFARDLTFDLVRADDSSCTHVLRDTPETRRVYPFAFELEITHVLQDNRLQVCWKITNPSKETLYFSIGGHPGFNCPVLPGEKRRDYTVRFGTKTRLQYALLDPASGCLVKDRQYTLEIPSGGLPLERDLFDHDALIFEDGQVQEASICAPDGTVRVTLRCAGFPFFGFWSKPGDAPFVCLEPWCGRADDVGFEGDLSEKTGENSLEAGGTFTCSYGIAAGAWTE